MRLLTKLDGVNTTLLNRCSQDHTFTNISDIDMKYRTLNISAKCNLNAMKFGNDSTKQRPKRSFKERREKGQMQLPNIHLNKSKYPLYGKETFSVISVCAIFHISKCYANKPKQ